MVLFYYIRIFRHSPDLVWLFNEFVTLQLFSENVTL
jgi:hypothetical protein